MNKSNERGVAWILSFDGIDRRDLPLVGGKGANLGEMSRAGFPIPRGFCVTTAAFKQFIDQAAEKEEIYSRLAQIEPNDIKGIEILGKQIRDWLTAVPMPAEVEEVLLAAWKNAGKEESYAVRSSATAEDLPSASFAGQQDTYLNVRGEKMLLEKVRQCWISLFTDRAILYRQKNNFSHRDVSLSVVVQQMIMSDLSGIMFTADPVTGKRTSCTIDGSYGLGEALVSGIVSPDLYKVDKERDLIILKEIGTKEIALWPAADGGIYREAVPVEKQEVQALRDEQIIALAKIGKAIEAHYGTPQDIEWGIKDEQIFILQSRPITSLFPIPLPAPTDDHIDIYFSMGHQQMMIDPFPPLSFSVLESAIPIKNDETNSYLTTAANRPFFNISELLRHPIAKRMLLNGVGMLDASAPGILKEAIKRPEFQRRSKIQMSGRFIFTAVTFAGGVIARLFWRNPTGVVGKVNNWIDESVDGIKEELGEIVDPIERLEGAITLLGGAFPIILQWVPDFVAGVIADKLISRIGSQWADPADIEAVMRGLEGNVVGEMNLAVGDLADLVRDNQPLIAHLQRKEVTALHLLETASEIDGAAPFLIAWNEFIEKYGMRAPSEIDISRTRWYEDPTSLIQMILGNVQTAVAGSHLLHFKQLQEEAAKGRERIVAASSSGLLGPVRAKLLRRLITVARNSFAVREHHKFYIIQIFGIIKRILIEVAEQFVGEGTLNSADDIWFLSLDEFKQLADGGELKELIEERKEVFSRFEKVMPPLLITSVGEILTPSYSGEELPAGTFLGNPVATGIVEGVAHVIKDPSRELLSPGEILVARFTDPGWTPLFVHAAGLVTEVGGSLTHGAVVAREYGIPAVVGLTNATTLIETGQRIRVDGSSGLVVILD